MSITYFQYVNICIYPTIDVKTQVENHDEKPKDQRNFYIWTVIFYIDGGISGLIRLFFNQSINQHFFKTFHLQQSLYTDVHLLQYLYVLMYSPNIFGRDYLNLNKLFQRYYTSPVHIQGLLQKIGKTSDTTKKDSLPLHLLKI